MGSVKDLKILEKPSTEKMGKGRFIFSDRYSVFDWGEMPDTISGKGAATAILGAYFFERLQEMGIPTHYLGLVENGIPKRLDQLDEPSDTMEIELLRVIHPGQKDDGYDYSAYLSERTTFLIPLEIIYRNSLPPGSSVFRRLEEKSITPEDLGLDSMPAPGSRLDPPILDVSTKLEITDRYITWEEAGKISGLDRRELKTLKDLTLRVNDLITKDYAGIGLVNEDGKVETGFDNERRIMLVDVLGTLDECRFTLHGLPVSKEIARIHYRKTPWFRSVNDAKKRNRKNWKEICETTPDPLPPRLKELISRVYLSCTNEITGREWFGGVPPLNETMKEIKGFLTP